MDRAQLHRQLPDGISSILKSINELPQLRRLNRDLLPTLHSAEACVDKLLQLIYPGYFGNESLSSDALSARIDGLAHEIADVLYDHVRFCLRYKQNADRPNDADLDGRCENCDQEASRIVVAFFGKLADVRAMLADDVQAAFDSDPAATSMDETIFCYPGVLALTVQRLAHELLLLGVPLLPRIWTEIAHSRTGIDIHPGAKLGRRFFIDHGTGVVIGETVETGSNVKIYQGVTLGALAPAYGQRLRGVKRHPTIEDDVTIYAGATILGGETIIGSECVIGGNVFLTSSVPPKHVIMLDAPNLKIRDRRPKSERNPDGARIPTTDSELSG